eukprot:CAMPEP_0169453308 /NCGR_PEP_ID=MMETSP1042-20121227/14692_1 /TAXON_ID=464988 /ORGANISM="Hemiselmis andersenii, Strain CCMP1180" /LENGTH=106 /DNA_ID=CAMNT_0009565339 /DNA_START=142 /DNA_END=462 /DNA_ORIENTATION=+
MRTTQRLNIWLLGTPAADSTSAAPSRTSSSSSTASSDSDHDRHLSRVPSASRAPEASPPPTRSTPWASPSRRAADEPVAASAQRITTVVQRSASWSPAGAQGGGRC